jgi:hypothetical protein
VELCRRNESSLGRTDPVLDSQPIRARGGGLWVLWLGPDGGLVGPLGSFPKFTPSNRPRFTVSCPYCLITLASSDGQASRSTRATNNNFRAANAATIFFSVRPCLCLCLFFFFFLMTDLSFHDPLNNIIYTTPLIY